MTNETSTPIGWYPVQGHPGTLRYWDGTQWTATFQEPWARPASLSGRGFAISSLVLGIIGGLLAILGLIAGPLAVILGSIAASRASAAGEKKTMAIWGIVLGAVSFLYALYVFS